MIKLDDKDKKILDMVQRNSKLTSQQISRKTLIPITTVHNRIKKLEKLGIIKDYTVKLDYKKLDRGLCSIILVNVSYKSGTKKLDQEEIAKQLKKMYGVETVDIVTGGTDILMRVRVKDVDELNEFIIKKLRNIEGVENTRTMIVLKEV